MSEFENIFEKIKNKYNASIVKHYNDNVNFISIIIENDKFNINHPFDIDKIGEEILYNIKNSNEEYTKFVNEAMDIILVFYADYDYQHVYMKTLVINNEEKIENIFKRYNWSVETMKRKLLSSQDYGMNYIKFSRKDNFYAYCHNDIIRPLILGIS